MFKCLLWKHENLIFVHGYNICSSWQIFHNNTSVQYKSFGCRIRFLKWTKFFFEMIRSICMFIFSTQEKKQKRKNCRLHYLNMVFKCHFCISFFWIKILVNICCSSGANCYTRASWTLLGIKYSYHKTLSPHLDLET